MAKSTWIKERAIEAGDLERHCTDLQSKLDAATAALRDIAAGLHYSNVVQKEWSNETKLQMSAADTLKRISNMQLRKKPFLYWSK